MHLWLGISPPNRCKDSQKIANESIFGKKNAKKMFCFGIYCIFALVFACSDRSNRKQEVFRDDNNLCEKRQKRYPGI